jgi:hypothetical protein
VITRLSERAQRIVRWTLLAGFVLSWPLVALWAHGPRVFWTGFFPLVPVGIVLIGFHGWRTICPLAAFNRFGARLSKGKVRRVGAALEKHSYLVSLGALAGCLAIRLLFINGDGVALGIFLALIALSAFAVGAVYTGKSWCNFFCPIGIVEKIYTEPASLYPHGNSQCPKCTACKKHCPDIDEENHYWKELDSPARRAAYFAFPGLVWGFYTAYALPRCTLDDYFSGAWTHAPRQYEQALAPGLFFAQAVPRALSVPVWLAGTMALSYGLFRMIERLVARRTEEPQRARHLALTLAAFTAFTSFYLFAGQPLYRRALPLPTLASVGTVLVATLSLVRRWGRREDDFVQERSVKKLLAKWPYPEPPPRDPKEVFAFVKGKERERDKVLAVYADAVREVLADGVVEQSEHRLLERLRAEFGISKAEHDKVLARLSAEDRALFDPSKVTSIEQRVQEQGYRLALQNLLLKHPREQDLEDLRRSYGIDPAIHARMLGELRSTDSPLKARVAEQFDRIDTLRRTLADVTGLARIRAFQLLALVLLRRQGAAVARVLEFLGALTGDEARLHAIAARFAADDHEVRREGLRLLAEIDPQCAQRLEPAVLQRRPPANPTPDPAQLQKALTDLAGGSDPHLAAAALVALAVSAPGAVAGTLARYAKHAHPLVREACALAVSMAEPGNGELLRALGNDRDARVRATAAALAGEAEGGGRGGLALEATTRAVDRVLGSTRSEGAPLDAGDFGALPTPERMLVLATIPLFADLEPEHLYDIAVLATERVVPADYTLCREGEPGDEVYVVIAGEGEVHRGEGAGKNAVGRVKPGDCVGELAVLDQAPRSATVRAEQAMRVLVIDGTAFRTLLARNPDLSAAVTAMITRRLRETLARLPAGGEAQRVSGVG